MFSRSRTLDFFIRAAIGIFLGVLFALLVGEGSYALLSNKQSTGTAPSRVDLVIPYGTHQQVEAGVYNRDLPTTMRFYEGDLLVIKNEDTVAHQLGPMVVPPNTSSVLEMSQANEFNYECSFQPTQYLGITVMPRVDYGVRFQGIMAIALPTGLMLAIYSYLIPAKKKEAAA